MFVPGVACVGPVFVTCMSAVGVSVTVLVVMMRFDSGSIGDTMNEVVAYGTAVKLAPA